MPPHRLGCCQTMLSDDAAARASFPKERTEQDNGYPDRDASKHLVGRSKSPLATTNLLENTDGGTSTRGKI